MKHMHAFNTTVISVRNFETVKCNPRFIGYSTEVLQKFRRSSTKPYIKFKLDIDLLFLHVSIVKRLSNNCMVPVRKIWRPLFLS